ncbi:hypothetical protein HMPREF0198_0882, partial [Cardiobacterium hominis ATCC 15826]
VAMYGDAKRLPLPFYLAEDSARFFNQPQQFGALAVGRCLRGVV